MVTLLPEAGMVPLQDQVKLRGWPGGTLGPKMIVASVMLA
jgi:hypothetical protein